MSKIRKDSTSQVRQKFLEQKKQRSEKIHLLLITGHEISGSLVDFDDEYIEVFTSYRDERYNNHTNYELISYSAIAKFV